MLIHVGVVVRSEVFGSEVGRRDAKTRDTSTQSLSLLEAGRHGRRKCFDTTTVTDNKDDAGGKDFYSGPATFLASTSPVVGSRISSQLTASSASPVVVDTANRTPSELAAVDRKSGTRDRGQVAGNQSSKHREKTRRTGPGVAERDL